MLPKGKIEQQAREREAQASLRDDEKPPLPESEPSQADEVDVWEEHGRKRSKKDRRSRDLGHASSKFSVPTDAFDNLQSLRRVDPDDEWDAVPKKSRKFKRDSGVYATPSRSAEPSEVSFGSSSKRSSKSKRGSSIDDDFDEYGDEPSDRRKRDPFQDREVSSVVSEPRYEERRRDKRGSRRSSRYDDDDAQSVASAPGPSRKTKDAEKRSSGPFSSIVKSGDSKYERKES